jgi:hypothetical protein
VIKTANRPSSLNPLRFYLLASPLQCITICGALQLPVAHWNEVIPDTVIFDAMRDRLEHSALTISITGNPCKVGAFTRNRAGPLREIVHSGHQLFPRCQIPRPFAQPATHSALRKHISQRGPFPSLNYERHVEAGSHVLAVLGTNQCADCVRLIFHFIGFG